MGRGVRGAGRRLEELRRRGLAAVPMVGAATVSVPGCVRAWGMLLERFGTRPLGELLQPAIHYAEHGFPTTLLVSQAAGEMAPNFDDPEWHRIFRPGGRAPGLGEPLVQADLARTLRDLAAEGPDLFYRGRIGAGHRAAAGGRRLRHRRRSGPSHGRMGRAHLDDLSGSHRLRDSAADSGTGRAARSESPGRVRSRAVIPCTRSSTCTC